MASCHTVTDQLSCRQVLNIMVILGFMLNYMLRVNLTIAIIAMVIPHNSSHSNSAYINHDYSEIYNDKINTSVSMIDDINEMNESMVDIHWKLHDNEHGSRYDWDEYEVNFILGAFFWGYICTEIPGGRLAEVIGAKKVFGYSMLISSLVTLLTPFAASYGYIAVAALRIILGFMLGATWPAIHPMISHWIPPTDRSKFMANLMASSLGAAVTMPMCGFLIASIGWESVFYVTGAIGVIWSTMWFVFIYDTPAQHPRISIEERNYIEDAIGSTSSKTALAVPWKSILTSIHVWAIIFTHSFSVFGYFTVVNQLPTYMKYILNFNIKENGILSALPYIGKYIFALATATLADYLRRHGKLTVTMIRKIFTTVAVMVPAVLMIVQARFGCDRTISVVIFTVALTINGAVSGGYLGNGLDIAPNFSGTIFGIANTLSSIGGYLSSLMVGILTYKNQTYHQWAIVFWILTGTYTLAGLTFLFCGSGELQKWNDPTKKVLPRHKRIISNKNIVIEEEAIPLKKTSST